MVSLESLEQMVLAVEVAALVLVGKVRPIAVRIMLVVLVVAVALVDVQVMAALPEMVVGRPSPSL